MSLFKKLFSSGNKEDKKETGPETKQEKPEVKEIYTNNYFNDRFTEQDINENPELLDGCLKMVESYFPDNKMERKIAEINHPVNLDQVVEDGMGFHMYCKAFQLEDSQVVMFLAFAFSEFLARNYGFKLYRDKQPEFPMRVMTLKYNKNGVVMSVYPMEYSLKVLNNEASFEALHDKLKAQVENMPGQAEMIEKLKKDLEGGD